LTEVLQKIREDALQKLLERIEVATQSNNDGKAMFAEELLRQWKHDSGELLV